LAITNSQGVSIVYDDLGQGEPALLFMPGWCANRTVFQDLLSGCSRHRRTLALDWREHGQSGPAGGEFGEEQLLADALSVITASRASQVVPVSLAQAGWVALKLRKSLGVRISKLVHLNWLVLEPPAAFLQALDGMQSLESWSQTVNQIFDLWINGVENPKLTRFVREEMGVYGFEMWSRAAREIKAAYARSGNPLKALLGLSPSVPVLHLYAQPQDLGYFTAQQIFAETHPWFYVEKLKAQSHFPLFEVPEEICTAIEQFVR
jgi:pimeloyl-ACP methyl ester carboxylesterase